MNGCNNPVTIPIYGVERTLVPGDNILEFTPTEEGDVTCTCWMGMIRSNIKVVADVSRVNPEDVKDNPPGPLPERNGGGSCCRVSQSNRPNGW